MKISSRTETFAFFLASAFVVACSGGASSSANEGGRTSASGSGGGLSSAGTGTGGIASVGAGGGASQSGGGSSSAGTGTGGTASVGAGGGASQSGSGGGSSSAGTGTGGGGHAAACGSTPHVDGSYCVVGNQVLRDSDGQAMLFHGANVPGLEWDANNPKVTENNFNLLGGWGATLVRVPLNQQYWLLDEDGYRARVASVVSWANNSGMVIILDLHRLDRSEVFDGQRPMANTDSVTFWTQVATAYKDNPNVFFDLYNEPSKVTWDEWENGGTPGGYATIGMGQLYKAVRDTGAKNIVLVGGIDFAYYLNEVLSRPFANSYNVVYVTHLYNYDNKQPGTWQADWLSVADSAPVFVTEFGNAGGYSGETGDAYVQAVLNVTATKKLPWTAWALFPWGLGIGPNAMIGPGWDPANNVFPLTAFGETVKNAL